MRKTFATAPVSVVDALEDRILFSRPTIGGLSATPNPVTPGASVTLVAFSPADLDGVVKKVEFYRDADGNGLFDKRVDTLVGLDGSPRKGWNAVVPTTGLAAGKYAFFARSRDDQFEVSKPAVTTVTVAAPGTFLGTYEGESRTNDGSNEDLVELVIDRQVRRAYIYGTFRLIGSGESFAFSGTIGKHNTFTFTFAGDASGTGSGTISGDLATLTGNYTRHDGAVVTKGTFRVTKV